MGRHILNMPKSRKTRHKLTPYQNITNNNVDDDHMDIFEEKKKRNKKAFFQHQSDPSPYDGLNQEEAEEMLLKAMLPNLKGNELVVSSIFNSNTLNLTLFTF